MNTEVKSEAERELDHAAMQIFHTLYAHERENLRSSQIAAKARSAAMALLGQDDPHPQPSEDEVNAFGRAFEAAGMVDSAESYKSHLMAERGDPFAERAVEATAPGRSVVISVNETVEIEYRERVPGGFWINQGSSVEDGSSIRVNEADFNGLMQAIQVAMSTMRDVEQRYPGVSGGSQQYMGPR